MVSKNCKRCAHELSAKNRILTTEQFIEKARKVHGEKYDYSLVEYLDSRLKIKIICPIKNHGLFEQVPSTHLSGKGCQKCGIALRITNMTSNTEKWIEKAKEVHGDRYDYSRVIYIGYQQKVMIGCPIKEHGYFLQSPDVHSNNQRSGCPICGHERSGWNRNNFIKYSINNQGMLYLIRCFNENEEFYKIGITRNNVKQRYGSKFLMPYNYEIILEFISESEYVWNLEKFILRNYKDFKYSPNIFFHGITECFNINLPVIKIFNNLKK